MGVVYEAIQESLGRRIALKILAPEFVNSPKSIHRFKREARAAARLQHANIVPVFGFGEDEGLHYYVMQLVLGRGIDQVIAAIPKQAVDVDAPVRGLTDVSADEIAKLLITGSPVDGPKNVRNSASNQVEPERDVTPADETAANRQGSTARAPGSGETYFDRVAKLGVQIANALAYATRTRSAAPGHQA